MLSYFLSSAVVLCLSSLFFFFFSSRRRHTRYWRDWSSDVCSSDLLTKVETMERYFRKQFMSQKTFSIEGLDVMVPMLEETISLLAEDGTKTVVLGMAHRGRLSTIAHVVNRPYEELLAEFESAALREQAPSE